MYTHPMDFDMQMFLQSDLKNIIQTLGYMGLFLVVLVESGLLVGFFFPGDSLLFTAGFLASQGFFDITLLIILFFIAAVVGDSGGYFIGHKFGKKLFNRKDNVFFHKDHLMKAEKFYEKHGGKTIILARFIPFIRTFAPVIAGISSMKYSVFFTYNIVGGFLWAVGLTLGGYFLGSIIPDVDKYLVPIVGLIILSSITPGLYHALKNKSTREKIFGVFAKPKE